MSSLQRKGLFFASVVFSFLAASQHAVCVCVTKQGLCLSKLTRTVSVLAHARQFAYRYRKFKVSADTELVVRCEIDGVLKHKGQDELLSVKALNEFDPKLTGQP